MRYKVFGCKVNKYYTDEWLRSNYLRDKTGIFIASCVVTDQAKKKWIKFVKKEIVDLKNNEKIYLSGCGVLERGKKNLDFFNEYTDLIDFKDKIEVLPESPFDNEEYSKYKEISFKKFTPIKSLFTKKFVIIQGGCDSYCTFCLTVIKRGKHFYRSEDDIIDEIKEFEKKGGKEIVLTGVNLGAWGIDDTNDYKNSKLHILIEKILSKTTIKRIRISSLGLEFINNELLKLFSLKRIYPHFHLSIQSGSSNILKKMRRHYDGEFAKNILYKIINTKREDGVDVSIGADVIVGFPGETEDDFLDTYNLVKNYNITKLHAFPFSNHQIGVTVPASYFPNQIDDTIKRRRFKKLLKLGDKVRDDFIKSQKGKELNVLIEVANNGNFKGWSENYIECKNDNFEVISGKIEKNEIIYGRLR